MLKSDTLARIAAVLKIKDADLKAAIESDKETDLTIDEKLSSFTDDEITTVKANSYKEGKKAGVEMDVDALKKEMGLDFTGKTVKGLVEAVSKKTLEDAKVEPDKKVTELTDKLKTAQQTAQDLQSKLAEKENEVSSIRTQSLITKDMADATLPAAKVLILMKEDGYDYKVEEGKVVWSKDGKAITDNLGNNKGTKDVTGDYVKENKLEASGGAAAGGGTPGGRGGKDTPAGTGVFLKKSEITTHLKEKFKAEGKSELGAEFNQEFTKLLEQSAKVEGFDMNG